MAGGWILGRAVALDLVPIGNGHSLHRPAAMAFLLMAEAARSDGVILRVNSAFRSMLEQRREWSLRQTAIAYGRKYKAVALPGRSTHQSGVSVDINRADTDHTNNGIADGTTDRWLQANASTYGWVNDVRSEPWHWTFLEGLILLKIVAGIT